MAWAQGLEKSEFRMTIQHWSDRIIIVDLPSGSEMGEELAAVVNFLSERKIHDVVIDLAGVEQISSSDLAGLLRLRQLAESGGRRLVLCGVTPAAEGIFLLTGLDAVFEITHDKFTALATLEMTG